MEIVSRTENKLLNRVEIEFRWSHKGKETPSKKEVMDRAVSQITGIWSSLESLHPYSWSQQHFYSS